ncbi:hypothetical protein BJX64DRAFT_258538 [Aspergillus heterothallicus]
MSWSIDTTLSFLSLFITFAWFLVAIWERVVHAWRRIMLRVSDDANTRRQRRSSNVDDEMMFEEAQANRASQTSGPGLRLTRRTQSA